MKFSDYLQLFDTILTAETPQALSYTADQRHYVELNQKRQERWVKKGEILPETLEIVQNLTESQKWILIAEPWCGDAAHLVVFIAKMAELNPKIELEIQLRDSGSEIDDYLTNGGKSIPILIVRDATGTDLFRWGPRPEPAQAVHIANLTSNKTTEEKKVELQKWYNADKGVSVQKEIIGLLQATTLIKQTA
ncbi:MAG: thioredoxin family protein [Crocinitomicaceae bacterium]